MTFHRTRRAVGLLAAVAIGAGALMLPAVATAAPAPAILTADTTADVALVDSSRTGQLTIHKLSQTDTNGTTAGNGKVDASATGAPIAGVTFTVQRLDFDLTTQAGWEGVTALNNEAAAAAARLDPGFTARGLTTGADGIADFSNLPLGAYLVTETGTPENVTPAEPFVVTLPMTDPDTTNQWMYQVHVYPKNSVTKAGKTVSDSGAPAVGDVLTYTVKADIPKLDVAGGATLKNYQIVDPLNQRLSAAAGDVTVSMIGTGAVALTAGTDYEIVAAAGADSKTYVTVTFTEAGRAKIAAARATGDATTQVQVVINATVKTVDTTGDGNITNTAYLIPNVPKTAWDPANPVPEVPGTPTPEVVSKYGKVAITKTGTDNKNAATYAGAQFQVYQCSVAGNVATGAATLVDADSATTDIDPLTVNGATSFTTGTDGKVTIDGLRNNDWVDGAAHETTAGDWYCLVEVKAPEGYELQTKPIPFQILQGNSTADNNYTVGQTVTDVPTNAGFRLPLTGAQGVLLLLVAGGLLIGGGTFLALANKRRRSQH